MKTNNLHKLILFILLVLTALPLWLPVPTTIKTVCGLFQAFYLPGIVFLRLMGIRRLPLLDDIFFPPILSPLVLTLLILGVHAATGSLQASVQISLTILYLLLSVLLLLPRHSESTGGNRVPGSVVLISVAFCFLFFMVFAVNDYNFAYDMVRHSAIANEILYRGIPPLEPFFPDIPIQSNWIAYVFIAALARISGLSTIHSMWVFSLFSVFAFPYLIARITAHFTGKRTRIIAAPLFALAGIGTAGWVLWPLTLTRAFVGYVHGIEELGRIVSQVELSGRGIVGFLTPFRAYSINFLEKYFLIDVQHYALNLFLFLFIIVLSREFYRRSIARGALTVLTVIIGAFLFHVFTGVFLMIAAVLSGLIGFVRERVTGEGRSNVFQVAIVPCCALIAAVICLSFFKSFRGVYADGVFVPNRIGFNLYSITTIAIPLIVLLPFSARALRTTFSGRREEYMTIGNWMAAFLLVGITVDIRGTQESFAIFPLFLLFIIPTAQQIVDSVENNRGVRRNMLVLWIAILFLVPPVLMVRGLMLDKPKTPHHIKRYRITDNERAIYDWIRDNTEIDAVIIERNEYNVMPYYAFRRNFCMTSWEITNYGYRGEKVERYKEIRDELYSGDTVTAETIETLGAFEFDIYVVVWREDFIYDPRLETKFDRYPEWFVLVYENPDGKVYCLIEDETK